MKKLSHDERLRLMKFVCSFAWTDLEIADGERELIARLAADEAFDDSDREQIAAWLKVPPPVEEVDPTEIPPAHRHLFLEMARAVVAADGRVGERERDNLAVFEELVTTSG